MSPVCNSAPREKLSREVLGCAGASRLIELSSILLRKLVEGEERADFGKALPLGRCDAGEQHNLQIGRDVAAQTRFDLTRYSLGTEG
jgi:hypothetical protein